jgi:predicted O-methyltransferase YrrM
VILAEGLESYLRSLVPEPDPVLAEMVAHGERDGIPIVYPETGLLLEVLVALCGARTAVEVGTAIGVSTLHIARALGTGGSVISFEVDAGRQEAARGYLERAGLADRADLRLQDGAEGLEALTGPFDFAFLDAFKADYARHLALVVPLLRPGGAVAIDNVLLSGMVATSTAAGHWSEEDVLRMRELNADLIADQGLAATVVPVGDGVAVAVRR